MSFSPASTYIAATLTNSPRSRCAKAVASFGTRASAPPSTRSWTAFIVAVDLGSCSRIASAAAGSSESAKKLAPDAKRASCSGPS